MLIGNTDHCHNSLKDILRAENLESEMSDEARSSPGASILIVDNDPHSLHILSRLLQREHYLVHLATTGAMALETAQAQVPDLILLDVCLSEMSGFEVCAALKQSPLTCDIPILFISALDDIEDKVKGFEVGGADYITKPFQFQEVLVRVRHQLKIRTLQKQLEANNQELQQAIAERQQAEQVRELLLTITQDIHVSGDFQTALTVTLKGICEVTGWSYGEVWVPTAQGQALECHPAWYLNTDGWDEQQQYQWQNFRSGRERLTLVPGQGLPTQVWQQQEPVWISEPDLTADALRLGTSFGQDWSLKGGAGFPILTQQGQVLAVLVFWTGRLQERFHAAMKLVQTVTMQLGIVLHNKQIAAKLAGLFAAMRDIILVFDSRGYCLEVVATNPELLYAPPQEQVGKNVRDILPADQADRFCHCITEALASNKTIAIEYSLLIQDQDQWFSAHISPISEETVIWVARDVTQRKRSEAVLRQREAELAQTTRFLDSIIETLPMAVFAKDVNDNFRYVLWNRAAEEIYGIDRTQALGRTLHELVSPELADQLSREHQPLVENRQLVIADEVFQSDFHREIWQRIRKLPLVDQNGQVTHLLYLAEDITEYKRLEAELKQTEDKYRSIVENAIDGIFQTSPTGDYLSANLALAKIYGYDSPEELLAKLKNSRQLYVNPSERDRFVAEIQPTGVISHFEVEVYRKDGSTIWVEENAREVRDCQGRLLYYEGIVTDITRRRQAEIALRLEKEKSERLLLNILPEPIADRLKDDDSAIAESYEEVSILFADIVDFTSLSAQMQPIQIVNLLNHLFSEFDHLVDRYRLEKIKTVGDAYMVAAGLPIPRKDHAHAIAQLAIDMQTAVENFATGIGEPLQLRIGINSGVVVAGVIGTKKFIYDLWGDTVNIASRMESHGEAGKIQVTEATYRLLCNHYHFIPRGHTVIKGRGTMPTYWLQVDSQ
ncbi:MAG: hypothetical protein OHK0047_32580 [Leptolyngbyaceae cyanobacterium]